MELFEIGDNSLTHVDSLVVVQVFLLLFHLLSPLVRVVVAGNGPEGIEVPLDFEAQPSMMVIDAVLGVSRGNGAGCTHRKCWVQCCASRHDLSLEPHHIVHGPSLH